jgi:hypothetical protein
MSIQLCCMTCGRSIDYDRSIDPSIPAEVVKITQPSCDECWTGGFEDETWYDAEGRVIAPLVDMGKK